MTVNDFYIIFYETIVLVCIDNCHVPVFVFLLFDVFLVY